MTSNPIQAPASCIRKRVLVTPRMNQEQATLKLKRVLLISNLAQEPAALKLTRLLEVSNPGQKLATPWPHRALWISNVNREPLNLKLLSQLVHNFPPRCSESALESTGYETLGMSRAEERRQRLPVITTISETSERLGATRRIWFTSDRLRQRPSGLHLKRDAVAEAVRT